MAIRISAFQLPDGVAELPSQMTDVRLITSGSRSLLVLFNAQNDDNQNSITTRLRGASVHLTVYYHWINPIYVTFTSASGRPEAGLKRTHKRTHAYVAESC